MDARNRPVGKAVEREILWREFRVNKAAFFETAWQIRRVAQAPSVIKLYDAQRQVLDFYDEGGDGAQNLVVLKARQIGWTTITSAYAFYSTFFHEYRPWLFISQNEDYAKKNLGMVKFGWARLPAWIKERPGVPQILTNTSEQMEWSNGGRIESIPATGSSGRGDAVFGTMWDETAHAPDPEAQYAAIDALVYGRLILLSSAKGAGNFFAKTYQDAQRPGSEWRSMFLPWTAREDRDDDWYARQVREKRATPWVVHQEYPRNDQEAFVKSGKNPIGHELMQEFTWVRGEIMYSWDGLEFVEIDPAEETMHALVMEVWEEPHVERDDSEVLLRPPNYTVAVDLAEGIIDGDNTVITVYNANTRELVARVKSNYPVESIAEVIDAVGRRYFNALVGVERNMHGWGVLNILDTQLHYPRLYSMAPIATRNRTRTQSLGWHTNQATKPKMVRDYARAMRDHNIDPRDPMLYDELMTFVQDDAGRYGASPGNHDDVVISHMINLQLMEDVFRFPIMWRDPKPLYTTMGELDLIAEIGPWPSKSTGSIGGSPQGDRTVRRSFTVVQRKGS
jgi:hypothetical protein